MPDALAAITAQLDAAALAQGTITIAAMPHAPGAAMAE
jgi:hypothetical protein